MMRNRLAVCALLLTGCGHKDITGRPLTDVEERVLTTCNSWLRGKMRGSVGDIDAREAMFTRINKDQYDVAWEAITKVGQGVIVCSTDGSGSYVRGALIDGIQVQP